MAASREPVGRPRSLKAARSRPRRQAARRPSEAGRASWPPVDAYGERVAHRAHLLGVALLEHREQPAHALDRDPHLVQVAHVLGVGCGAQALAAQVHEAHDGLQQHVLDRDPAQLLLEPRAQLLLAEVLVILVSFVVLVALWRVVAHRDASPQGAVRAAPDSA